MKILLRRYGDRFYVWEKAEFKHGRYITKHANWEETDIVAIKEADNTSYVVCNYCGEKIPDNPESIEHHFAEKEAKKDCLNCGHCRPSRMSNKKVSVSKNSDGTYSIMETSIASALQCDMSWQNIEHPVAQIHCVHSQCRRNGTSVYGGVLMKYPDLFETQITNDLLLKKKYEYSYQDDDHFMYDLKCRKTFFAAVNEVGIVEYFKLTYNYRYTYFVYSAKYDKLFYMNNRKYTEGRPNWVSQTKYDQILARVRGLYKGVKVDE